MRPYIALIHKDPKSDFGVSFPDLPGCISAGATLDEARAMAEEALALHLEGMADDGLPIPEPSTLAIIMATRANRDAVAVMVEAPKIGTRSVRVNISLSEDMLARIDDYVRQHKLTRSGFLARAAQTALGVPMPRRRRKVA